MPSARNFSNVAAEATLVTSIGPATTSFQLSTVTGFPSVPFTILLAPDTVTEEACLVTNVIGTTVTVTRGYNGTTALTQSIGANVKHAALAIDFSESNDHINTDTVVHGLTIADVITTTNTKTMTSKTLTAPVLTAPVIVDFTSATHDHGDVDSGGLLPAASVKNRPVNTQSGTTFTFTLPNAREHVLGTNAGTKTFTIPLQATVAWLADAAIPVTNLGSGILTLAIAGGGTLNGSDLTLAQGESVVLLRTASDVWWCLPFSTGSGAVARGTLSGTTGSPSTSSNGGATAYKWTADGTFTVATAGLFSGLVVGGGGGGGKYGSTYAQGGGGGGGQVLALTDFYLAAGTYTVTVGAGGAASVAGARPGNGETSVLGPFRAAGGGCGSSGNLPYGGDGANGGGCDGQAGSLPGRSIAGGYTGGDSSALSAAGGGAGAGGNGSDGSGTTGGAGGAGVSSSITGSSVTYGGGGGGGGDTLEGAGGSGGGGAGAYTAVNAVAGTANTGGGGGGCDTGTAGAGGSGVVILLVGTV